MQIRVNLAVDCRLVDLFGWSDLLATHLSARVPNSGKQFLKNPLGMLFEEMDASSLVRVDEKGRVLSESDYGINPAEFMVHSAVHMARPKVVCVIHTHTQAGLGVAQSRRKDYLPLTQYALTVNAHTGYH